MKNISTGTGLCVLGLCLASYPVLDRVMPKADASATHAAAIAAAVTAQVEPTIVWYGVSGDTLFRAWSSGRVEATSGFTTTNYNYSCGDQSRYTWSCFDNCGPGTRWVTVADPAQGLTYRSDINFDSKVDGADLGTLLADWGDAPRQDIPPSDCPLNLINP
jgi:hypothetical protein